MNRYLVARSMAGTYLAVRYTEKDAGQIEDGEVVAEFREERVAREFCQTWYGKTEKLAK